MVEDLAVELLLGFSSAALKAGIRLKDKHPRVLRRMEPWRYYGGGASGRSFQYPPGPVGMTRGEVVGSFFCALFIGACIFREEGAGEGLIGDGMGVRGVGGEGRRPEGMVVEAAGVLRMEPEIPVRDWKMRVFNGLREFLLGY